MYAGKTLFAQLMDFLPWSIPVLIEPALPAPERPLVNAQHLGSLDLRNLATQVAT